MNMTRLLSAFAGFLLLGSQVLACCIVSPGEEVLMTHENVVIVWDEKAKIQHFIRQASFDSEAKNFGFIVPTPSVPNFSVAKESAFSLLQELIPPPQTFGCGAKSEETEAAAGEAAGGVEVLKTEQVGDYQATVVKATDGNALNEWLKKNGFVSRPAMTPWLDGYTKKQWVFTALKYKADKEGSTNTNAIRISFKTDQPHYPYKMPEDTWPKGHNRPLKLYFVAANEIDAKYVDTKDHWEAEKEWSGPLPESRRIALATDLGLKESDLPPNAKVTIFKNGLNENGYDEDLMFVAARNTGTYIGGGIVVVLFGAWLMIQRNRRKFVVAPG